MQAVNITAAILQRQRVFTHQFSTRVIDLVEDTGSEAAVAIQEFHDHAERARDGESLQGVPIAGEDEPDEAPEH